MGLYYGLFTNEVSIGHFNNGGLALAKVMLSYHPLH